jgi:hypothetical protein
VISSDGNDIIQERDILAESEIESLSVPNEVTLTEIDV